MPSHSDDELSFVLGTGDLYEDNLTWVLFASANEELSQELIEARRLNAELRALRGALEDAERILKARAEALYVDVLVAMLYRGA